MSNNQIQVVNKLTGEVLELPVDNPVQIKDAWLMLSETIKMLERAKDKLKPKVEALVAANQADFGTHAFRQSVVQRQTYDKAVMREVFDADTLDLFLVPDKTKVDNYLKENLESLGDASTKLRQSMVPVGTPYTTIRLEKVKRDED